MLSAREILFERKNLLEMAPEERPAKACSLPFSIRLRSRRHQQLFLARWLNALRKYRGQPELDAAAFLKLVKQKMKILQMPEDLLKRSVNEGFSGGEKKRNEIFQMAVLEPRLCILDETDSGLDIDALRAVSDGVNALRSKDRAMVVITHYQRFAAHRAGLRTCLVRRPYREVRRQRPGAGTGNPRLRPMKAGMAAAIP